MFGNKFSIFLSTRVLQLNERAGRDVRNLYCMPISFFAKASGGKNWTSTSLCCKISVVVALSYWMRFPRNICHFYSISSFVKIWLIKCSKNLVKLRIFAKRCCNWLQQCYVNLFCFICVAYFRPTVVCCRIKISKLSRNVDISITVQLHGG